MKSLKKIIGLLAILTILTGCVESMALLGPATSVGSSGKVAQSAVSSVLSYGVKKQTGKTPSEHALAYVKKHNPENKKTKCLSFVKKSESKVCEAVKQNIIETKEYFKNKKKKIKRSKIEDLAKKSVIYNRR